MPTSAWGYITPILNKISNLHNEQQIRDILDVGTGGGKWGFLSRDLIDYYHNSVYYKKDWELNIEGIEAFSKYKNPVHDYVYDKVYYQPIQEVKFDKEYDIIFFMEVIEHMEKEEGLKVLDTLLSKVRLGIFLSFPPEYDALGRHIFEQQETHDNAFETHRSIWSEADLVKFNYEEIYFNTYFISRNKLSILPWSKLDIVEKDNALILTEDTSMIEYVIDKDCQIITISTIKHAWSSTILILDELDREVYKEDFFRGQNSKNHEIHLKNNNYKFLKIKRIASSSSKGNEIWIRKVTLLF
jgi:SAM-dependent methyltransferase